MRACIGVCTMTAFGNRRVNRSIAALPRYEINATPLRQSANSPSSVRNRRHWAHVTLVSGSESRRLRTALLPDLSQTVKGATRVRVLFV
jgi:hypothetical protein